MRLHLGKAVAGGVILVLGVVLLVRAAWLGTVGEETSGTVDRYECRERRTRCWRVIAFYTPDGRRFEFNDATNRGDLREGTGSRVDFIRYDPDDPNEAMVYDHANAVMLPALIILGGLVVGGTAFVPRG